MKHILSASKFVPITDIEEFLKTPPIKPYIPLVWLDLSKEFPDKE